MIRSYRGFALVSILLLQLHLTLGELQQSAAVAKSIGKVAGESSPSYRVAQGEDARPERIRAQLAGGFIDDSTMVHKNGGATQRQAYASGTDHRPRAHVAGSGRKMAVHGTSGPIHTYIKTDKNANFKWGVRHFVGAKYAR